MLEFRLKYLNDFVDYHILVESTHTFSGKKKELFYHNNKDTLFKEYKHKIIHVVVDKVPNTDTWENRRIQVNSSIKGFDQLQMSNNDIIIFTDLDEIPDKDTLRKLDKSILSEIHRLEQDWFYYNLECKAFVKWSNATVMTYDTLKKYDLDFEKIRHSTHKTGILPPFPIIKNGGWHFSYFGGIETIIKKVCDSEEYQKYANDKYIAPKKLQRAINNQTNFLCPKYDSKQFRKVEIKDNEYLPEFFEMLL